MGTSGGNINNIETFICYSGTLGALLEIEDGGSTRYFVLSNNHIIARENKGYAGEGIVQPGLETASLVDPAEEMEMRAADRAQRRVERQILDIPGVTGIGLSQDSERCPVITVLATSDDQTLRDAIPARIDGFVTNIMVAGPFSTTAGGRTSRCSDAVEQWAVSSEA